MSEIYEIILFYSKYSENSKKVLQFIQEYSIPIGLMCIDSQLVRNKLSSSSYFKIKGVPTLIITYEDGNSNLYEGSKVLAWLSNYVRSLSAPHNNQPYPSKDSPYSQYPSQDNVMSSQYQNNPSPMGQETEPYELLDGEESLEVKPKNKKEEKSSEIKNIAKLMEQERKKFLSTRSGPTKNPNNNIEE